MKMIIISKENFNNAFDACLDRLKIDYFEDNASIVDSLNSFKELHRKFHYEICKLKSNLEEG